MNKVVEPLAWLLGWISFFVFVAGLVYLDDRSDNFKDCKEKCKSFTIFEVEDSKYCKCSGDRIK